MQIKQVKLNIAPCSCTSIGLLFTTMLVKPRKTLSLRLHHAKRKKIIKRLHQELPAGVGIT